MEKEITIECDECFHYFVCGAASNPFIKGTCRVFIDKKRVLEALKLYDSSKQSKNQRTLKVENGQPIAPDFTMEELEYSTKHKDKL